MKSLDTNIVLRFLLHDNPVQSPQITQMIAAARPNSFAVADAVLFECVWVLQSGNYQFDRQLIGDLVLRLTRIEQISCNRVMVERVVPLYLKHAAISFIDLALVVYAELNNAQPLLTYDKKMLRQLSGTASPALANAAN